MRAERAAWFARLSVASETPVPLLKAMSQRELSALVSALNEQSEAREKARLRAENAAKRRR